MAMTIHHKELEYKKIVAALFERAGPVLVEVRFPGMATAPDWHLVEDEEDLDPLLESLGAGCEVYLNSVWDLRNCKDPLCIKK